MFKRETRLLLMLCGLVPGTAVAQSAGTISGAARDTSGAVLPGVTVEASSPALIEKVRTVVTDDQGRYAIVELRPGTYTVTFALPGFRSVRREALELTAGFTATVNAELQVGDVQETITVTGATPVVDVQGTTPQRVLSRQMADAIPGAKTFNAYVALVPGVTNTSFLSRRDVGGKAGEPPFGLAVHGSDQGFTTIDGFLTLSVETPSIHKMNPNAVAMEETQIETGNGSAESWTAGVNVRIISKAGGNALRGTAVADYSGEGWDTNNLTDRLRARGLRAYNKGRRLYDVGVGVGGPIVVDRLWFFGTPRKWVSENYVAGIYYNQPALEHTLFYEPDLSRQATLARESWDTSGRITWQAAPAHKLTFQINNGRQCFCPIGPDQGNPPEGGRFYIYGPQRLVSSAWSYPATNRILIEAGLAYRQDDNTSEPTPGVLPTDRGVLDVARNIAYAADLAGGANWIGLHGRHPGRHWVTQGSLSYVTGSHTWKTGWTTDQMHNVISGDRPFAEQFVFQGRVPIGINQLAVPNRFETAGRVVGVFAQDRWVIDRLTMNLGARFDYVNGHSPAQVRPGGKYLGETPLEAKYNTPNWKDVNPRLGGAYDLFGNGKTALKASVGRFGQSNNFGLITARAASPVAELVLATGRTWTDHNTDYVPDCDLTSRAANGECGAMTDQNFGTRRVTNLYSDDVLQGWNVSPKIWQSQVTLQQQLAASVGLTVGYFRTWYRNFTVTDNLAVTPSDYTPYCVTAAVDARLPNGGGYQVCDGLFNISREKFGAADNLVIREPRRTRVFNGVDALITARLLGGYLLTGGFATGQRVDDLCATPDVPTQFCRQVIPWKAQTELKLTVVAPLPWWGLQASGTFQNLPGIPSPGVAEGTTQLVSNAEIAPSLGRNLAACPQATGPCNATAIVTIVPPYTMFEPRENQLDVRLSKIIRFGRARVQANFDVYNLFNIASVLALQTRYGPTWMNAQSVLPGRFVKIGAQLDF